MSVLQDAVTEKLCYALSLNLYFLLADIFLFKK